MSFSHISHASMKTLVAGIAAAATLCTGAIATMQTANAADASTAPSVAGHAYNDLPVGNPDVTVTQIDNSALPATLRNPIGQNEGTNTPNDLSQNYYSADASTLEYDGKLFVFTGHDEAEPTYGSFNMKDWGVYVTDNPESGKWTHYKTIAKADLFDWATGDGAYAGQVVVDDAGHADGERVGSRGCVLVFDWNVVVKPVVGRVCGASIVDYYLSCVGSVAGCPVEQVAKLLFRRRIHP